MYIKNGLLILMLCFAAKAASATLDEKPPYLTFFITPNITVKEKIHYEKGLNLSSTSYISQFSENNRYNFRNIIDFDKIKINHTVKYKFLPIFDYAKESQADKFTRHKSKNFLIPIITIQFPFF